MRRTFILERVPLLAVASIAAVLLGSACDKSAPSTRACDDLGVVPVAYDTGSRGLFVYLYDKFRAEEVIVQLSMKPGESVEQAYRRVCPKSDLPPQGNPFIIPPLDLVDGLVDPLNADAQPDFAAVDRAAGTVLVHRSLPDGSYADPDTYPVGDEPAAIAAGDFTGDGRLDLVTANRGAFQQPGDLSLLVNHGDGTFAAAQSVGAGGAADVIDVAVGHFNNDAHLDLAAGVLNAGTASVVVRLGNGNGTFQPAIPLATPNGGSRVAAADLNPDIDDHDDLLTDGSILLGNGDGSFQPATDYAAGFPVLLAAAGDLDGDARADIVAAGPNTLSVLRGRGRGTFEPPLHYWMASRAEHIFFTESNEDGDADLFIGFAPGTAPSRFIRGALQGSVNNPVLGGQPAVLLPGAGGGSLGPRQAIPGQPGERVVAGDWNGDTFSDLAFAGKGVQNGQLFVSLGNNDGTFTPRPGLDLDGARGDARFLAAARIDAGDVPDLLVATRETGTVSVFLGDGNGGFTAQALLPAGTGANGVAAGDFNRDSRTDLAISRAGTFGAFDGGVSVALGNGDGTFQAPVVLRAGVEADSLVVADFDRDGDPDIAAALRLGQADWDIEVYPGRGDGGFQDPRPAGLEDAFVEGLAVLDLDLDNRPDLAVSAGGNSGGKVVLKGDGTGAFRVAVREFFGESRILPADLDLDGVPDLVASSRSGFVGVVLNRIGPVLEVVPASGMLSFSWPERFDGFSLRRSTDPGAPAPWDPTPPPAVQDGRKSVQLDPGGGPAYFRLEETP